MFNFLFFCKQLIEIDLFCQFGISTSFYFDLVWFRILPFIVPTCVALPYFSFSVAMGVWFSEWEEVTFPKSPCVSFLVAQEFEFWPCMLPGHYIALAQLPKLSLKFVNWPHVVLLSIFSINPLLYPGIRFSATFCLLLSASRTSLWVNRFLQVRASEPICFQMFSGSWLLNSYFLFKTSPSLTRTCVWFLDHTHTNIAAVPNSIRAFAKGPSEILGSPLLC